MLSKKLLAFLVASLFLVQISVPEVFAAWRDQSGNLPNDDDNNNTLVTALLITAGVLVTGGVIWYFVAKSKPKTEHAASPLPPTDSPSPQITAIQPQSKLNTIRDDMTISTRHGALSLLDLSYRF